MPYPFLAIALIIATASGLRYILARTYYDGQIPYEFLINAPALYGFCAIAAALIGFVTLRAKLARRSGAEFVTFPFTQRSALLMSDVLTFFLSYAFFADHMRHPDALAIYVVFAAAAIGTFWLQLEHYWRRRPMWDELREVFRVIFVLFLFSATSVILAKEDISRLALSFFWLTLLALIPLARVQVRDMLDRFGLWERPAVVVGTGENAREAWLALRNESSMGYRLVAFVAISSGEAEARAVSLPDKGGSVPIIDLKQLEALLPGIQIVFAMDSLDVERNQGLIQSLVSRCDDVHFVPSIRGLPLFGTRLSHFFSHEVLLLTLRNNLARPGYRWIKRSFDFVVSCLLLLALSPLFLYLSAVIRRDGGNAFYGHMRIGRNGIPFNCLKFRSMRVDADQALKELLASDPEARAEWERDFKLKNDPRITKVGNFLRRTSLDELPQLINVIRGEMSLVGPRPIVQQELERYGDCSGYYLEARPGITGLWQISGRNDTTYAERVSLDSWYVRNYSLWYDIAILFRTVGVVMLRKGAY